MMDIPIHAKALCNDGQPCGYTTYVILNPVTETMTHVVVKRGVWPHDERLVPIEMLTESTLDHIQLDCPKSKLAEMDSFIQTDFIESEVDRYLTDPYVLNWPFHYSKAQHILLKHERIPVGELAVRRGARVEASDGYVGHVDGFMVDETSEHITHLVLREGHLWGQKDVNIPIFDIDHIDKDVVHLKLDKKGIAKLPVLSVQ